MRAVSQVRCPGSSVRRDVALYPKAHPTLRSLLHPHPPLWGVHTFPASLECSLSAPSPTKETLTAINYHRGWTKGIPLCWNIASHTHLHQLHSSLHPHMNVEKHHLVSIGLHRVWQMSLNVLSLEDVQSACSLAECLFWVGQASIGVDSITWRARRNHKYIQTGTQHRW